MLPSSGTCNLELLAKKLWEFRFWNVLSCPMLVMMTEDIGVSLLCVIILCSCHNPSNCISCDSGYLKTWHNVERIQNDGDSPSAPHGLGSWFTITNVWRRGKEILLNVREKVHEKGKCHLCYKRMKNLMYISVQSLVQP